MDVLTDVMAVAGVRSTVGARIDAGSDWGWWNADRGSAALHAVTSGTAWVAVPGAPPRELHAGDVVLLPRGSDHAIGSDPRAVARTSSERFDAARELDGPQRYGIGSGPLRTRVLCAHYRQDPRAATQLLAALPDVLHVRASCGGPAMEDAVRLLGRELADPGPASAVVLDALVDVLLVQLLRTWLADLEARGLPPALGALRDPVASAAVAALHADPARDWTTASLASAVPVSRATLARRFLAATGETPIAYLTRWRMDLAARRLREGDEPLGVVALEVGYGSLPAFTRAFARARGTSPGRFRAQARAQAQAGALSAA